MILIHTMDQGHFYLKKLLSLQLVLIEVFKF